MPQENILTSVAAWAARPFFRRQSWPKRVWKRPSAADPRFWRFDATPVSGFTPPRKALILKTGPVSQVMLTTPLLAVLGDAYPQARFDWAVSEWARPAVAGNPRLTELFPLGNRGGVTAMTRRETAELIARLRRQAYDTCFIPSRSLWLSVVAWRAGIPQRVGLDVWGRGSAHTIAVRPRPDAIHEAEAILALARAIGVDEALIEAAGRMEFYPPDLDRTTMTARLVEELDWLGDAPLVVMHPGGGVSPWRAQPEKRWPAERFALLGNHLVRAHGAKVVLVGVEGERPLAEAVAGMTAAPLVNLAGRIGLGELGALSEVADLYVGNDTGPTQIAAAAGCPTLAIFGPSDPAVSAPFAPKGRVQILHHEPAPGPRPFSWEEGVTVREAIAAAEGLLAGTAVADR